MAGDLRSWFFLGALGLTAVVVGCLPDAPAGTDPIDEQTLDLVTDLEAKVISPSLQRFHDASSVLRDAVLAWQSGGDRAEVRPAFLAAMEVWQELEVQQVGPAGSSLSVFGGEDLRDEIYSWPTVNPCRVDQVTVSEEYAGAEFVSGNLVNAYGLDVMEHLLFVDAGENACPSQVDINASGDWDALGLEAVDARRGAYALVVVDEVLATTDILIDRWDPQGGDFASVLADEGTQATLDAVYRAMFYVELVVKDKKLAEPVSGVPEGTASGQSAAWVAANLRGFRTLFTGADGVGFDDLLAEEGHSELSDQVLAKTDAALAIAEAGVVDVALYDAVKELTDALKGDVLTVLSLKVPTEAAGDAD